MQNLSFSLVSQVKGTIAGLVLILVMASGMPSAHALDVEFDTSEIDDAVCGAIDGDGEEDTVGFLDCEEDEATNFTDFEGDFSAPTEEGYAEGITTTSSAREFIVNVTNFVLSFLGLAAIVVIIYGGFMYVTAGGEQERADKGRKSVTYAVIGIIVVLISYALVNTLVKGAASGSDVTSNGGLYSSGTISGDSVTEFQSTAMAEDVEALAEQLLTSYTRFLNVNSVLEAMAQIAIFNEDGLSELEEGFDLILLEVPGLSETADLAREAQQNIRPYASFQWMETMKTLFAKAEWMQASTVMLALEGEDTTVSTDTDGDSASELFDSCYEDTCSNYDPVRNPFDFFACFEDCAGEANTLAFADPYSVGAETLDAMAAISESSKDEFIDDLEEIEAELAVMQESFEGMDISNDFDTARLLLAIESISALYIEDTYTYTYLQDGTKTISLYENAATGSSYIANVLERLNEIHSQIKNLEFTEAVISANTNEGNSPLIVTFNGLDSSDPTNLSLSDSNYEWDLDGDGEFEETGSTVSKTYELPGTYVASLRVTSNRPTTIAAGISYLTIKVYPPSSNIHLEASTEHRERQTYPLKNPDDGTDELTLTISGEQAKAGVTFDASGTEDGEGNTETIVKFDFDFGDGDSQSGENPLATHYYSSEGTYEFVLEVTDQNGITDRAIVTVIVSSPAAHIDTSRLSADIGETINFDASSSITDNGQITTYEWSISNGSTVVYGPTSGEDELEYSFDAPGTYTVTVNVTDSAGESDDESVNVTINSTPPVAIFDYSIPDAQSPNRVHFNALKSYDPDDGDTLTYEWTIEGSEGIDYTFEDATTATSQRPIVEFQEVGEYEVTLTAYDQHTGNLQQTDSYTKTVTIDSTLGIDVQDGSSSGVYILQATMDASGNSVASVTPTLNLTSNNGISYLVDWADGSGTETIPVTTVGASVSAQHTYAQAGTYPVKITVYDTAGDSNFVVHNLYIGNGTSPIPVIDVTVGSIEFADETAITGNRTTSFTFDGSRSVDVQGESLPSSNLSWNFGDGTVGNGKTVTRTFEELGTYTVTLTAVSESTQTTASTSVTITIEDQAPVLYGLTVEAQDDELLTPLSVKVSVEAEDVDGEIVQYRYWYYDVNNSNEEFGSQIANTNSAYLTINTNGDSGDIVEYGFGVELTDNENNKVRSEDYLEADRVPTLEVENGPNQAPEAELEVDRTSVLLGESVTFSAVASDDDGTIVEYVWDVEGDGFYNNESTTDTTLTYTFETSAPKGIDVRVKVVDDGGATGVSDPIRIYVDSLTDDPEAAFTATTDQLNVTFTNNSSADTDNGAEIANYSWDFDTSVDSDGNGSDDDDTDSNETNPQTTYDDYGTYEVSLTLVDSEGNSDSVTQTIELVATDPPEAAFTYEANDLSVTFTNNSSVEGSGISIVSYSWDFDTLVDSDGNGTKEDDVDSTLQNPSYDYDEFGQHRVKLTVTDSLGRTDDVTQVIEVEESEEELIAYLTSSPEASQSDGKIHLTGRSGNITFSFSATGTNGATEYCIDKNVYFDSDGDGDKDNDCNHSASSSGSYTTDFAEEWGLIVVKLMVTDESERSDSVTVEVKFDEEVTTTSTSILPVTTAEALYILATAMVFTLLGAKLYTQRAKEDISE